MNERQIMSDHLALCSCPCCGMVGTMFLTDATPCEALWPWKCSSCSKTGNIGYDLHELTCIDLPHDKEEEFKRADNYSAFLDKWGVRRPKTKILFDQDPSLY